MITDIFVVEAGSDWKPPENDRPRPEIGPQPQIQEITYRTPQEIEREERDKAVIRGGVLDWMKKGGRIDDLIKKKPEPPVFH